MITLKVAGKYQINFMDSKQDPSTWFSGEGVFVSTTEEDFGTGEQHYVFRVEKNEECCFPESSVGRLLSP